MRKKIAMIGSTQYRELFASHRDELLGLGHDVRTPAFDDFDGDELDLVMHNIEMIRWADEVHLIWDARSVGTVFDLGVVMALNKPLRIVYIESKTLSNLVKKYSAQHESEVVSAC